MASEHTPRADAPNEPVDPATRRRAIRAAQGLEPFDLLLTGGTVVDVGTGELRAADVGIVGPLVASVHATGTRTDALQTLACDGRFVAPGLIDMHVHFESSMLTPTGFAEAVCPRGTTTVSCDPHELANVVGLDGVRYAIDASRGLPVRFLVQAPSCVPPMPGLELGGCELHGPDIAEMLSWPDIASLAEVMDYLGVLSGDERMEAVMAAGHASGKLINGHASGLTGQALQAYLASGIQSDHNVFTSIDLLERVRAGMTVELCGYYAENNPEFVAALGTLPTVPTHVVAATDDLFALTLLDQGGIDHLLRELIRHGLEPVTAFRIATYNAAYRLQRTDLGLVAPGRRADLIVLSDLATVAVEDVITSGVHVASNGRMIVDVVEPPCDPPLGTMKLGALDADDFVMRLPGVPDGPVEVRAIRGSLFTEWTSATVDVTDGHARLPDGAILQVVVHRHGRIDPVPQAAVLDGWGHWTGAVATTVSHDTHNLVVFGRDPHDMAAAANAVIAAGGGIAVATAGAVTELLELPIAGILSALPAAEVAERQRSVKRAAMSIGLRQMQFAEPLFEVTLASLPCVPGPHVTDVGIADGTTGRLVDTMVI
jgi:adenine deaminase